MGRGNPKFIARAWGGETKAVRLPIELINCLQRLKAEGISVPEMIARLAFNRAIEPSSGKMESRLNDLEAQIAWLTRCLDHPAPVDREPLVEQKPIQDSARVEPPVESKEEIKAPEAPKQVPEPVQPQLPQEPPQRPVAQPIAQKRVRPVALPPPSKRPAIEPLSSTLNVEHSIVITEKEPDPSDRLIDVLYNQLLDLARLPIADKRAYMAHCQQNIVPVTVDGVKKSLNINRVFADGTMVQLTRDYNHPLLKRGTVCALIRNYGEGVLHIQPRRMDGRYEEGKFQMPYTSLMPQGGWKPEHFS